MPMVRKFFARMAPSNPPLLRSCGTSGSARLRTLGPTLMAPGGPGDKTAGETSGLGWVSDRFRVDLK